MAGGDSARRFGVLSAWGVTCDTTPARRSSEKVINRQQGNKYLFLGLEHLTDEELKFGHVGEGFLPIFGAFSIEREMAPEHSKVIGN